LPDCLGLRRLARSLDQLHLGAVGTHLMPGPWLPSGSARDPSRYVCYRRAMLLTVIALG
jgi:hypothetical protein